MLKQTQRGTGFLCSVLGQRRKHGEKGLREETSGITLCVGELKGMGW